MFSSWKSPKPQKKQRYWLNHQAFSPKLADWCFHEPQETSITELPVKQDRLRDYEKVLAFRPDDGDDDDDDDDDDKAFLPGLICV